MFEVMPTNMRRSRRLVDQLDTRAKRLALQIQKPGGSEVLVRRVGANKG